MRKLSVQIQKWTEEAVRTVERTRPESLKLILPGAWAPDRITTWARAGGQRLYLRLHTPDDGQDLTALTDNTLALIRRGTEMRDSLSAAGLRPEIILLTPINERMQTSADLSHRAPFEIDAIRMISEAGFVAGFGNYSVGNPPRLRGARIGGQMVGGHIVGGEIVGEDDDWRRLFPLLAFARAQNSILILHQYWRPEGLGPHDPWTALRHRLVWERLPPEYRVRTALGEVSLDNGIGTDVLGGFRFLGLDGERMAREHLAPFAVEITRDPYLVDAHIFLCGSGDPSWHKDGRGGWGDFDIAGEPAIEDVLRTDIPGPALWVPSPVTPSPTPHPTSKPTPSPPPVTPKPSPAPVPIPNTMNDWYPAATRTQITRNFTAGRAGRRPQLIVDHIAEGNGSPFGWFNREAGDQGSSAHFWVGLDGRVEQYRPVSDTCWANGPKCSPDLTNPIIKALVSDGMIGMNSVTVAVEHAGFTGQPLTVVQIAASARLHQWLSDTLGIPLDRTHVVGHYQIDRCTRAQCPGPAHPWAQILGGHPMPPIVPTADPLLEANVLAPLFRVQDWLAHNAKTERQREYQRMILFAFRDMKGEVPPT